MAEATTRPLLDVLREYRNGALSHALNLHFGEVLAAVAKERKAGSLTLTIKVTPESSSAVGMELEASVSTKTPKPSLPKALFFLHDGGLFRNDPGQADMFEEHTDPVTGEITQRPKFREVGGNG